MEIIPYRLELNHLAPLSNHISPYFTHGWCILNAFAYIISTGTLKTNTPQYPLKIIRIWGAFEVVQKSILLPTLYSALYMKHHQHFSNKNVRKSVFVPLNQYKTVSGLHTWSKLSGSNDNVKPVSQVRIQDNYISIHIIIKRGWHEPPLTCPDFTGVKLNSVCGIFSQKYETVSNRIQKELVPVLLDLSGMRCLIKLYL